MEQTNSTSINQKQPVNEIKDTLEIIINFNHLIKLSLKPDSKLIDLREMINSKFLMKDDEYEIYIKDLHLLQMNLDLSLSNLIQNYQTNEIVVKSFKSKIIYNS
jgi:hypothetical protein